MKYKKLLLTTSLSVVCLLATEAVSDCGYSSVSQTQFKGQIESVRIKSKNVIDVSDIKRCIIKLESRINGQWFPSEGKYSFGPELSETKACDAAIKKAKLSIMEKYFAQTIKSKSDINCSKKALTLPKKSCRIIYMNVEMGLDALQRVKMETCS